MVSNDAENTILTAALRAHAHGCSVLRVRNDGQKRPVGSWDQYQSQPADETTIRTWFEPETTLGLGIVTGSVSNNLEMFELEGRAMEGLPEVEALIEGQGLTDIWQRVSQGWVEQSPSGGVHYFYRVAGAPVPGNQKVAQASRENGSLTLAETRGEGGFVVVAPSAGTVHPTGQPWVLTAGGPDSIPTLTSEERDDLLALFASVLDERAAEAMRHTTALAPMWQSETAGGVSPGDDFEAKTSWEQILEPEGWTIAFVHQGTTHWCRPGKEEGTSATTGHADDRDRLFVFSSSTPFETETPITKFHAYAVLHHGGDHTAAAAALALQGFGVRQSPQERVEQAGPVARWEDHNFGFADVYVQNDSGNGQRISSDRLAFCVNPDGDLAEGVDGQVWVYEDGRFIRDDNVIKRRTVQTMGDYYQVRLPALARDKVMHARGFPRLTDAPPDQKLINVKNGMVRWATGELLPHDASYLSQVQLAASYSPEATCPKFDAWLAGVGDADVVKSAWEVIAYSVLSGNPFQKAAAIVGKQHTGKGTFIRVLQAVVGRENCSHVSVAQMAKRFPPAELYGKLLNTVGDHPTGFVGDASEFKQLTGADDVMAEFKNQQAFTFRPWVFSVFGMNDLPVANDASGGWLRRWTILRFDTIQPNNSSFHEEDLYAERDGILAKAVLMLPELIARNDFSPSFQGLMDLADLAERADVVLQWLGDDENILAKEPGNLSLRVLRSYAWAVYQQWSRESGHKGSLTRNNFYKRLGALGYGTTKYNGDWCITGLKVNPTSINSFGGHW